MRFWLTRGICALILIHSWARAEFALEPMAFPRGSWQRIDALMEKVEVRVGTISMVVGQEVDLGSLPSNEIQNYPSIVASNFTFSGLGFAPFLDWRQMDQSQERIGAISAEANQPNPIYHYQDDDPYSLFTELAPEQRSEIESSLSKSLQRSTATHNSP